MDRTTKNALVFGLALSALVAIGISLIAATMLVGCARSSGQRGPPGGHAPETKPLSACERLHFAQTAACRKLGQRMARIHGTEVAERARERCRDVQPARCIEASGTWGVILDDLPYPPQQTQPITWRVAHVAKGSDEPGFSKPHASNVPPTLEVDKAGQLTIAIRDCLAHNDAEDCTAFATSVCAVGDLPAPTLHCLAAHALRRPNWIAESIEVRDVDASGRTQWRRGTRWDAGSSRLRVDPESGQRQVELEVAPLVVSDGDVTSYALAGPTIVGRIDPDGSASFEHPADIDATRNRCERLGPPTRARPTALWASALCAQLLGRPTGAVVADYRARCLGRDGGVPTTQEGALLHAACRIDADNALSSKRGVPAIAARYLSRVHALPK